MSMKLISFVFSFKNEEKNLKELVDRVDKTIKKVGSYKYELIFVNDNSNDSSENILEDLFDIIFDELKKNGRVKITNFGTFTVRKKNSRIGRNPKTKEIKTISERNVILFKPSNEFKKKININND